MWARRRVEPWLDQHPPVAHLDAGRSGPGRRSGAPRRRRQSQHGPRTGPFFFLSFFQVPFHLFTFRQWFPLGSVSSTRSIKGQLPKFFFPGVVTPTATRKWTHYPHGRKKVVPFTLWGNLPPVRETLSKRSNRVWLISGSYYPLGVIYPSLANCFRGQIGCHKWGGQMTPLGVIYSSLGNTPLEVESTVPNKWVVLPPSG